MGATPTIYARSRDRWRAYTSNTRFEIESLVITDAADVAVPFDNVLRHRFEEDIAYPFAVDFWSARSDWLIFGPLLVKISSASFVGNDKVLALRYSVFQELVVEAGFIESDDSRVVVEVKSLLRFSDRI
jgi:hypothetical protein